VAPFTETAVVEHLEFIRDDEGDYFVGQTFLEHQQTTYSAIAVLERMNALEVYVESEDVFQRLLPMLPFNLEDFCSLSAVSKGEIFPKEATRLGSTASQGMFQVFPVKNAPSIFPLAQ
jgi:hypothetical protein